MKNAFTHTLPDPAEAFREANGIVEGAAKRLRLSPEQSMALMAQSNCIVQIFEQRGESPRKALETIGRYADMIAQYRGERFQPRISARNLAKGFTLYCIEPPCGSNTYILRRGGEVLFIDSGFACYAPEMHALLCRLFPDFDGLSKRIAITHPDEDHCGLLHWFERIYVSPMTWEFFRLEAEGQPNFRERNPMHAPYTRIIRILSQYAAPPMERMHVIGDAPDDPDRPICYLGGLDFCGKRLDFYRGNGGHAVGEAVIVDESERLVFSGDIAVNPAGFTAPQAAFNRLAPCLMKDVNMDSGRFREAHRALLRRFPQQRYTYCCGHGAIMDADTPQGEEWKCAILD